METGVDQAHKEAAGIGPGPKLPAVIARTACYTVLRYVFFSVSVVFLVYVSAVAISLIPFSTITTTPETEVINTVGLDLQSLKHILFESELSQLYAPSPPPPPATR